MESSMPKPLNILQILPELGSGGVERGTVEVAKALRKAGHHAFIASAGGPMVIGAEAAGAVHLSLPLTAKNPYQLWRNCKR